MSHPPLHDRTADSMWSCTLSSGIAGPSPYDSTSGSSSTLASPSAAAAGFFTPVGATGPTSVISDGSGQYSHAQPAAAAAAAAAVSASTGSASSSPASGSTIISNGALPCIPASLHILVVDDQLVNQKLLQKMLVKLGHTCDIAEDGFVAIERVHASYGKSASTSGAGRPYDLILDAAHGRRRGH